VNGRMPSRASPLPQWTGPDVNLVYTNETCGSGLAREEARKDNSKSHPATPDASFKTPLVSHHAVIVAETNIL
jgi:hypothetical protein